MKAETPAQKIKRLERELSDERLRSQVLEKMVQDMDRQPGTGFSKKHLPGQCGSSSKRKA